jgi:hypothetical protein
MQAVRRPPEGKVARNGQFPTLQARKISQKDKRKYFAYLHMFVPEDHLGIQYVCM